MIQSAVLATELTEDGTAARLSDDPARQPRGERLQPRPARLLLARSRQAEGHARKRLHYPTGKPAESDIRTLGNRCLQ